MSLIEKYLREGRKLSPTDTYYATVKIGSKYEII